MDKTLYKTGIFDLDRFRFRLKGANRYFYKISSRDSVAVLPIFGDGSVILERQYRPAIRRYLHEIPAGLIEKGERPVQAAFRELEEETGYRAGKMRLLFAAYPSPGIKTEFSTCYLATDLVKTATHMDPDEVITIKKVRLKDLVAMIRKNQIIDAKTIAAVLFYTAFTANSPA